MDIRSMINSDTSSSKQAQTIPPPSQPTPRLFLVEQEQRAHSAPYPYENGAQHRPGPPPPLQPVSQNDFRSPGGSSTYHSAQSPYQHTPSSAPSSGQYPFPQISSNQSPVQPQHPHPASLSHHHSYPSVPSPAHPAPNPYAQQSPSSFTPTAVTPGGHTYHQRPPSISSHSTTPQSAQSQPHFTHRDSPLSAHSQSYPHLHQNNSLPGTPLGPPGSLSRTSAGGIREPQSPYSHQRTLSSTSHNSIPFSYAPSPTATSIPPLNSSIREGRPNVQSSSLSPTVERRMSHRDYAVERERERSLSVSPKTKTPSQINLGVTSTKHEREDWAERVAPVRKRSDEQPNTLLFSHPSQNPNGSNTVVQERQPTHPVLNSRADLFADISVSSENSPPTNDSNGMKAEYQDKAHLQGGRLGTGPPSVSTSTLSNATVNNSRPGSLDQQTLLNQQTQGVARSSTAETQQPTSSIVPDPETKSRLGASNPSAAVCTPLQALESSKNGLKRRISQSTASGSASSPQQPRKKRTKYAEIPIFARKANGHRPIGSNSKATIKLENSNYSSHLALGKIQETNNRKLSSSPRSDAVSVQGTNGSLEALSLPRAQPQQRSAGPLEPWEPSFLNIIPHEELTRSISDFLYTQVIERDDVGFGAATAQQGAVIEVEAKIGQLIDKNTNERLRLPVETECVVSRNDPSLRIAFKSSMTASQHQKVNEYLNRAIQASLKPGRISMAYKHPVEVDAFYELSSSASLSLPPSIRNSANKNHQTRLRVTTDQKTGEVKARIIKVRVADLDVYSPRTPFDWRVSVNLEMNYKEDEKFLTKVSEKGANIERKKDRVSYNHLAYQIDLTQVTPNDKTSFVDKEHELEIEVNSKTLREQGLLAKAQKPSQYEDLVRGFVDNVRLLARIRE